MNRFNVSVRKIGKKFGKETTKRAQRNQSAAFVGFGDEWDKLVSFPLSFHPILPHISLESTLLFTPYSGSP